MRREKLSGTAALWGGLMLALPVAYFAALAPYGLNVDDEGTLLYQIYRTYLGQVLYVDFHAGYTPGLFYWNAALFSLFGVNVVVLRLCLAVVNGLSVYCLYWLARRLGASPVAAAVAGLVYLAFIPYYDGQFAAFNIPYPIWYVTLFWLLSVIATVRWWERGQTWHWLIAGACTGVVFTFKPNSGLLNLAVLLIALTRLQRPQENNPEVGGGVRGLLVAGERSLRWLIPWGLALALTLLFIRGAGSGRREALLFALPLVVLVAYQHVTARGRRLARAVAPLAIWRDLLLLAIGFAVVILPWVAYFWSQLGTRPFLRAVLFLGTNFDRFYFMPYPELGQVDAALGVAIFAAWAVGVMIRHGWLPLRLVGGAIALVLLAAFAWLLRHPPPMVEGFQISVVTRLRSVAFGIILVAEWLAIGIYLAPGIRAGRAAAAQPDADPRQNTHAGLLLLLLLSAVLMHMQLYPRTDFMHLVPACPGILVLVAWLLERLARQWAAGARTALGRGAVAAAAVAPLYLLVVILIAPALVRISYLARAWWEHDASALVRLDNPRAPLVLEPAAGEPFESLSAAARYLTEHARPDEFVFSFPALDLVSFLADRQNPTRHGYFYPGWPGREVEAEVIDSLRARQPRYIVALHGHAMFFMSAPIYYFNLRQYVTDNYRLERRIGNLDLLAPNHAAGPPAAEGMGDTTLSNAITRWRAELQHHAGKRARRVEAVLGRLSAADTAALAATVTALDAPAQRVVAGLIRKSRSAEGAAALALALEEPWLDPTMRELFLRAISEVGDLRSVAPLLRLLKTAEPSQLGGISGSLFTLASRSWLEDYWYAPPARQAAEILEATTLNQIVHWLDNPWESPALRSFAIRVAGWLGDRAAIPFLVRLAGDPNEVPNLRVDAAHSLVELGFGTQMLSAIAGLIQIDPLVPAVLTVKLYPQAPALARALVAKAMRVPNDGLRAEAFWVAAATHDPGLIESLQYGLQDAVPEIRIAAAWALANEGAVESIPALEQLARDGNDQVAAVAARAVRRVKGVRGGE
ncbi:MAG: HEAT repeat domain-containing protein [Deltaproteobacteria bacterium]|nr:HEAT repeat domain-containing protein [Deltaproteobacteria bacterium]